MTKIEIYTIEPCPYCTRAKELLKSKGQTFKELRIDQDDQLRQEMLQRAGGLRTVPQIFINDHHIGGCDDLYALNHAGKLDALLK